MRELVVYNFFPKHLNLYGDRGNIEVLKKRCEWRDIELVTKDVTGGIGAHPSLEDADILYMGGGSDRDQQLISQFLNEELSKNIRAAIKDGVGSLAICGGYQLLGQYYQTLDGSKIKGLELFDYFTKAGTKRLVGDVLLDSDVYDQVVGFENHAGQTFLTEAAAANTNAIPGEGSGRPLGRVVQGYGNNDQAQFEGYQEDHFIGTYLHGPLLPKNPKIADQLIQWAIERKYGETTLAPLEETEEVNSRNQAIQRMKTRVHA